MTRFLKNHIIKTTTKTLSKFIFFLILTMFVPNALRAECSQKSFDLSIAQATSSEEILNEFASMCAFSVIIQDENAAKVLEKPHKNINIKRAKLREIFNLLLREQNLHHNFDGKILRIASIKSETFVINYITSVREGQSVTKASVDARQRQSDYENDDKNNEDNVIKSVEKFDFWQSIEKELNAILSANAQNPAKVTVNANAGLVTVSGTLSQLKLAKNYIEDLQNRLKKQVAIDVSIVAVNLSKTSSTGINWANFGVDFNSQKDGTNSLISFENTNEGNFFVKNLGFSVGLNLNSVLNFLRTNGETTILSSPKLVALNNQQAIISVGDTINYQVKESSKSTDSGTTVSESYNNYSIFIGILLNILPEISNDGRIMLRISPSLSSFKYPQDNRRQDAVRTIAPDTVQKKLSTVVQMENNQTLILGGLISRNEAVDGSEVNFLGQIPLLGRLFKGEDANKNSTELVFIIRPQIIETPTAPSLAELGFGEILEKF